MPSAVEMRVSLPKHLIAGILHISRDRNDQADPTILHRECTF